MTVLEGLFPEQVRCFMSTDFPDDFNLLGTERDQLAAMTAGRQREFIHGRSCARLALAGLGHADCAIPSGPQRAPVWPDGIVGSISHCGDAAVAAVAHRNDVGGIGLDLEAREELDRNLLPMICLPHELAVIETSEFGLLLAKLVFSAKESVFKCIWPRVQRFVDFLEVGVELDLDASRFVARPHSADLPDSLFRALHGRIGQADQLFVTAAYFD